ncbi:zinc finger associated protein [Popillia japonica]|uniref:Zinc finger associated protein n=1 Tax=Popillia japonica TaxID=7064 RepID=A0AAW1LW56_POPJA
MAPSTARKRKGSSSPPSTPSRRIKVTALVHSPTGGQMISTDGCLPSRQKTDTPKPDLRPNDDINNIEIFSLSDRTQPDNNTQSRSFPPLPSRPQRPQLPTMAPAQAAEKTRPDPPPPVSDAKIPPVVLRDKTRWSQVSSEIKLRGISFTKAQNIPDGIRIYPSSEADYRTLTKFFSDDQIPYHTYQLPSEKLLNVVLRGVPVEIEEKAIYDDLRERGFEPDSVIRMRRTRDKAPMPLVLVKISKEQKAIYHLNEVVSLEVSVETLQCHSCWLKYPRSKRQSTTSMRSSRWRFPSKPSSRSRQYTTIFVSGASSRIRSFVCAGPEIRRQCHSCWLKYPRSKRQSTTSMRSSRWRCTATRKCVACAGEHEPGACERPKQVPATCANCGEEHPANYRGCGPKQVPATCANCGEEHPANYRGCARFPKSTLRTARPTDSPANITRARPRPSPGLSQARPSRGSASSGMADGGRSYSQAVTGPSRSQTQGSTSKSPKVRFSSGRSPRPSKDDPATEDGEDREAHLNPLKTIPDYFTYRADRLTGRRGGVALLVKKHIEQSPIYVPGLHSLEVVGAQILVRGLGPLRLFSVYVPPGRDPVWSKLDPLFSGDIPVLAAGDYNAKHSSDSPTFFRPGVRPRGYPGGAVIWVVLLLITSKISAKVKGYLEVYVLMFHVSDNKNLSWPRLGEEF